MRTSSARAEYGIEKDARARANPRRVRRRGWAFMGTSMRASKNTVPFEDLSGNRSLLYPLQFPQLFFRRLRHHGCSGHSGTSQSSARIQRVPSLPSLLESTRMSDYRLSLLTEPSLIQSNGRLDADFYDTAKKSIEISMIYGFAVLFRPARQLVLTCEHPSVVAWFASTALSSRSSVHLGLHFCAAAQPR